ncbi:MAG TPA: FAD-binding protein [Caulobacteraceae bacterium]|jgi:FAD/FMN-containing dehydrogenase
MKRRQFLGAGLSLAAAATLDVRVAAAASRVRPGDAGWPSDSDWAGLSDAVGGRLSKVTLTDLSDPSVAKQLTNPFFIGDQVGLTESSGWLDAWRSAPSAYAVTAQSAADIAAAVRFASAHNLRLVIKGRGHSYLGGSNAPDSLLVWTRHMDDVTVHDAFTPQGAAGPAVPAVSCGAGAMWLHAYEAVTGGAGRYVQGGGCTTVGVAGLVQGGGFGSFSKAYGAGAASLIEAEIVTADGRVRVVNATQEPDLFWALKGGGGGTFGVVTRLTLATHELPQTFGAVQGAFKANSDQAFRRLLTRFVEVYATKLFNPHFGETVQATPDNGLRISMVFQGLTQDEARAAFQPLADFVAANPADYATPQPLQALAVPARLFWNASVLGAVPGAIVKDGRPDAAPGDFWWATNTEEAGIFWHAYQSAWLPERLLAPGQRERLADAWFAASRHWETTFHFNKGLAGAPPEAIAASRDTAMNPDVLTAFALVIIGAGGPSLFTHEPDVATGHAHAARVADAMREVRAVAPDTGAYVNECDYFQPDWQRAFWGPHYQRLLAVKRRYDPTGLFTVHHGVGSEGWSTDGFTRSA